MTKNTAGAISQPETSHQLHSTTHMALKHRATNDDATGSEQVPAYTVITSHCHLPIQQQAPTANTSLEFATLSSRPDNKKGKAVSENPEPVSSTPANSEDLWTDYSKDEERQKVREFWQQLDQGYRRLLISRERRPVEEQMKHRHWYDGKCCACGKKNLALQKRIENMYDGYCNELQTLSDKRTPNPAPTTSAQETSTHGIPQTLQENGSRLDTGATHNPPMHPTSKSSGKVSISGTMTDSSQVIFDPLIENALAIADDHFESNGHRFLDLIDHLIKLPAKQETKASKGKVGGAREKNTLLNDILGRIYGGKSGDTDSDEDGDSGELTEEQEIRNIIQLFTAKIFEERVVSAYREKVAKQRQERFLQELDEEDRCRKERQLQKQIEKGKKKEAKRLLTQQKEDKRLAQENQRKAYEEAKRLEREHKDRIGRQKQEAERQRKQEECQRRDDKRRRSRSQGGKERNKKGKDQQEEHQRQQLSPPQQQQLLQPQPKKMQNGGVEQTERQHSNSPMIDLNTTIDGNRGALSNGGLSPTTVVAETTGPVTDTPGLGAFVDAVVFPSNSHLHKSTNSLSNCGEQWNFRSTPLYIPFHSGITPSGSSLKKDYNPSLLIGTLPSPPEEVFQLDNGSLYPLGPHATNSENLCGAILPATRPRKPSVGAIGDSIPGCKRQSSPPIPLPAPYEATFQQHVDMLVAPPGMGSLNFLLERLEPPDYHSTQRHKLPHQGPDLRPSASMDTGFKISHLGGCFTNWTSGWDASDALTSEISTSLFGDGQVTLDQHKRVMDKEYSKADIIDQKSNHSGGTIQSISTSSPRSFSTLAPLHPKLSNMNNEKAATTSEFNSSLNSSGAQHELQCVYSLDHRDYVVSHIHDPQLLPKQPQEQVNAQAASIYYSPALSFFEIVPSFLPGQRPISFVNTGEILRALSFPHLHLQYTHMSSPILLPLTDSFSFIPRSHIFLGRPK